MKRLTLAVMAVLFLPMISLANVRTSRGGWTDLWCDDKNCYLTAVTNNNQTMPGHRTSATARLTAPNGTSVASNTGLVSGSATARVSMSHGGFKQVGNWEGTGYTGQLDCPYQVQTASAGFFSRRKKLGVSNICVHLSTPSWVTSCKPVKPIIGPQVGWNCTYVPIENCWVKCVASIYTIYVVGASTIPAATGTVHKGWEMDVDTGEVKCSGFVVSFIPDGIPGVLPCRNCWDDIIMKAMNLIRLRGLYGA